MIKCGKGCMPECQYFTTCGCISPFNCPYKIVTGYINSATSTPHIMSMTNEEMIENLKCVIADISVQCNQLKAENAELRARLEKAVELPCKIGDTVYQTDTNGTRIFKSTVKGIIFDTGGVAFDERAISESIFLTEEAVKEKTKKLQEKSND